MFKEVNFMVNCYLTRKVLKSLTKRGEQVTHSE